MRKIEEKQAERLAKLEADGKNIFHQLDEIKNEVRDIRRLTSAVEKIAVKTDDTAQRVADISERLECVEQTPAEDFKYYKRSLLSSLATGIIGLILGAVFSLIIK